MFQLADNEKIGGYLEELIDERYESRRQFCIECLKTVHGSADSDQIRRMTNRLSAILKGRKGIQLTDLPVFSLLLGTSCEEILSAGKDHCPTSAHLTNYALAFSEDPQVWERACSEESTFLNADEYGKTIIDYALEARNYSFLKYLVEKNIIWFVDPDDKDYFVNFGAGTSVKRVTVPYPNNLGVLDIRLKELDNLRTHMAALAIRHEDLDMLDTLRAREIPPLYRMDYFSRPQDIGSKKYYNAWLVEAVAQASDHVLEYFFEEFEIVNRFKKPAVFLFPFISELIKLLIQQGSPFAAAALNASILHNQSVYHQLATLIEETVQQLMKSGRDIQYEIFRMDIEKAIQWNLEFADDGQYISYYESYSREGLVSNIVRVDAECSDPAISRQIDELNQLYDAIHNIRPDFDRAATL